MTAYLRLRFVLIQLTVDAVLASYQPQEYKKIYDYWVISPITSGGGVFAILGLSIN
jgi:hypothetical protein